MGIGKWFAGALLTLPALSAADSTTRTPPEAAVRVSRSPQGRLELQATQAPLAQILGVLEKETGVRIRYSLPPGKPDSISARCAEASLPSLLQCLLGREADLMLTFSGAEKNGKRPPQLVDIKILDSSFSTGDGAGCAEAVGGCRPAKSEGAPQAPRADRASSAPDDNDRLWELAHSSQSKERARAIGRLAVAEGVDTARLDATLRNALSDAAGEVRAQAVFGLARQSVGAAFDVLGVALHDRDPSVRLMAVDSLEADEPGRALLQEALADRDATVREYAAMKLSSPEERPPAGHAGPEAPPGSNPIMDREESDP